MKTIIFLIVLVALLEITFVTADCSTAKTCDACLAKNAVGKIGCYFCPTPSLSRYFYPDNDPVRIANPYGLCLPNIPVATSGSTRPHCLLKLVPNWLTQKEQCADLSDDAKRARNFMDQASQEIEIQYTEKTAIKLQRGGACASQFSCIDCLMKTPAHVLGFLGTNKPYCRFCPKNFMASGQFDDVTRVAESMGACVETSGAPASDNKCTIHTTDLFDATISPAVARSRYVDAGPRASLSYEQAFALCENYKGFSFDMDKMRAFFKSESLFTMSLQRLLDVKTVTFILQAVSDDIAVERQLRSVDIVFFQKSFEDKTLRKIGDGLVQAALGKLADSVAGGLGDAVGGLGIAVDVYDYFRQQMAVLYDHGSSAMTQSFSDVSHLKMWNAYQEACNIIFTKATFAQGLEQLIAEVQGHLPTAAGKVANGLDTVWNSLGAKITKYGALTIAGAAAGGIPAIVAVTVGIVDIIISLFTSKSADVASDNLLRVLMLTLAFQEGVLTGALEPTGDGASVFKGYSLSVPCDITLPHPNRGCPIGWFCKTDFNFFPVNSNEFKTQRSKGTGFCAPRAKKQLPNGAPCTLPGDCLSGYCSIAPIPAIIPPASNKRVSARDFSYRGDQEVPLHVIRPDHRLMGLIGRCMRATGAHANCKPADPHGVALSENIKPSTLSEPTVEILFEECPDDASTRVERSYNMLVDPASLEVAVNVEAQEVATDGGKDAPKDGGKDAPKDAPKQGGKDNHQDPLNPTK